MSSNIQFDNAVPFESVIKSISRGAPCNARQLDEMASENATKMQYLMLSNIQNGIIEDTLPHLSHIDEKYKKYCLKDNDLILSKNGYPYKLAVAKVPEGHEILANGNLFSITTNFLTQYFCQIKGKLNTHRVGICYPTHTICSK